MQFRHFTGPTLFARLREQIPAPVRLIRVKSRANQPPAASSLAPGQLWKMKHVYVRIVELGKELIRFQMLDALGEDGSRVQTSGIETLWGYLKSRHAQLVKAHRTTPAFSPEAPLHG